MNHTVRFYLIWVSGQSIEVLAGNPYTLLLDLYFSMVFSIWSEALMKTCHSRLAALNRPKKVEKI